MKKTIGRDTVISFGKYQGKTGAYVAQCNPRYIIWMEKNMNYVQISSDLRRLAVCVGMMQSEESAISYGTASDWGFSEF